MNNQKKRGFSLVEVMVLFAALAVAMAAMLPVITKKSKAVPRKVSHGVYRCIAYQGRYLEETYNSFRRLKSDIVDECHFTTPNASMYKVELYGAGAGGTKYAAYEVKPDVQRTATLSMDQAAQYARDGGTLPYTPQDRSRYDMPFKMTNDDYRFAFSGLEVIQSVHTADAEEGGSATMRYMSPSRSTCLAAMHGADSLTDKNMEYYGGNQDYLDNNTYTYTNKRNIAYKEYIQARRAYENREAYYEQQKKPWQEGKEAREKEKAEQESYLEAWQTRQDTNDTALTEIAAAKQQLDAFRASMDNLKYAAEHISYSDYSYNSDVRPRVDSSIESLGIPEIQNSTYAYWYYPSPTSNNNVTYRTISGNFDSDENYRNLYQYYSQMQAIAADIDRMLARDPDFPIKVELQDIAMYAGLCSQAAKAIYNNADSTYKNVEAYRDNIKIKVSSYQNKIKELEEIINDCQHYIDGFDADWEKAKPGLQAEIDRTAPIYNDAEKALKDRYSLDNGLYSGKYKRPKAYEGQERLKGNDSTIEHINDYCRAAYPEYYQEHNNPVLYFDDGFLDVQQFGGEEGRGMFVQLTYTLTSLGNGGSFPVEEKVKDTYKKNKYPQFYNGDKFNFPYVKYIGNLYGNIDGWGYEPVMCVNGKDANKDNCQAGTVQKPQTNSSKNAYNDDLQKDGSGDWVVKALKGRDAGFSSSNDKIYIQGFHTPDTSTYDKIGLYVYPKYDYAKGGAGGVVGYKVNDKTYSKGQAGLQGPEGSAYETNYADTVFREGNSLRATKGSDASSEGERKNSQGSGQLAQSSTTYSIVATNENTEKQPQLVMTADMWTKEYSVGQQGSAGQRVHVKTPTLGTRCEFKIPQGGPMFDYMRINQKARDLNYSEDKLYIYRDYKRREYQYGKTTIYKNGKSYDVIGSESTPVEERPLTAQITCRDKEGNTVFEKLAEGGEYNIEPSAFINAFIWNRNISDHKTEIKHTSQGNIQAPSRWAKVFHIKKLGELVMQPLTNYNVASGGSGTVLHDKCTAPRGTYGFHVVYLIRNNGGTWTREEISNRSHENSQGESSTMQGVDCYRDNNGEFDDKTPPRTHIRNLDNLAKNGEPGYMDGTEKQLYVIDDPSSAGGGAVVITW